MWTLTIGAQTIGETDLTSGELAAIHVLVNEQVTHLEQELLPAHCPVCRHAFLAVLAGTRTGVDVMAELVRIASLPVGTVRALVGESP